jgi:hypothetical protein
VIEARGATLRYLPKYSPDLNPIEMPFGKLKADLRKAAERTIPRLRRRIGLRSYSLSSRGFQLFQARRLCVKSTGICSSAPTLSSGGNAKISSATRGIAATALLEKPSPQRLIS